MFDKGIDLNALPQVIDKINDLLELLDKIPNAPELEIDFEAIQKILSIYRIISMPKYIWKRIRLKQESMQ